MAKPRVIDVKKPPAPEKKPRVLAQLDKDDDFSLLLDEPSQELRKEQFRDLKPQLSRPGDKLEASESTLSEGELKHKIEQDQKKRKGGLLGKLFR